MNPILEQTDNDDEMENNQIVQLYRRVLTKETTPLELDNAILESFRREFPKQKVEFVNQAAQNDPVYAIKHGLAFSQCILPLAASDGTHKNAPVRFIGSLPESIGGEWSLTRENLPQEPDWQILKFKCREELIDTVFRGRNIEVRIGEKEFSLGKVDRRGLAEAEIPRGLDLQQEIEVRFGANKE